MINNESGTIAVQVYENRNPVTTLQVIDLDGDPVSISIIGGRDATLFSLDTNNRSLSFAQAPDYEHPLDSDADNAYGVTISATDGRGGSDTLVVEVTVEDDWEGMFIPLVTVGSLDNVPLSSATNIFLPIITR